MKTLERYFVYGLMIFISFPTLRIFFKYFNNGYDYILSLTYFVFMICLFYYFSQSIRIKKVDRILLSKHLTAFILVIMFITIFYIYPFADNLKAIMRGSDQDNCVILGITNLLNISNPYLNTSYYGNPCSTGFGVYITFLPFVIFNIYSLGNPFLLAVLLFVFNKSFKNITITNIFLIMMSSSFLLLELMVVGSDLPAIGYEIAILSIILLIAIKSKSLNMIVLSAILVGLIGSSRINFLIIPFITSVYVYIHWKKGAFLYFTISILLALLPSYIIYILNPDSFAPLHLIGKSSTLLSTNAKYVGILLSIITFIYSFKLVKKSAENIDLGLLLVLMPSLIMLSFGDLLNRSGFSTWEGANYFIPLVPLVVLVFVRHTNIHNK